MKEYLSQTLKRSSSLLAGLMLVLQMTLPLTVFADPPTEPQLNQISDWCNVNPAGGYFGVKFEGSGTPPDDNVENDTIDGITATYSPSGDNTVEKESVTITTDGTKAITKVVVKGGSTGGNGTGGNQVYTTPPYTDLTAPLNLNTPAQDDTYGISHVIVCYDEEDEPETGSITIVKDAKPNNAQNFDFTTSGTGLDDFSLDDDNTDTPLSNTEFFDGLAEGDYTINETAVSGWDLKSIECVLNNTDTLADTDPSGDTGVTIHLDENEDVTCTFTNLKRGTITVQKVTDPENDSTTFPVSITGTGTITGNANQSLSTDQDVTYEVGQGTYEVTEDLSNLPDWKQTGNTCNDLVINASNLSATCTITNEKQDTPQVDYCDPTQRPAGQSIAQWLASAQFNGADCFKYEVIERCGYLDVKLTKYPTKTGWAPYAAVYTTNGTVVYPANSFPANFTEDQNGGSVEVTWYIVGPEKDYLKGFSLPNFWDGTSLKETVVTDCDQPEPEPENGRIVGHKVNDKDGDQQWDQDEEALPGWTINIYTCTNDTVSRVLPTCTNATIFDSTTTDANGAFAFNDLTPGVYMVCEAQQAGWEQTFPSDNVDGCHVIDVDEGEECIANFGNKEKPGQVLGETTTTPPQVLATTGTPLLQGLLVGLTILGFAGATSYFTMRKQYNY